MKIDFAIFILMVYSTVCRAQTSPDTAYRQKVYNLGEVRVTAREDKSTITSDDMRKYNTSDVSSSLRILPSIVFSNTGARNESAIYLRGYDIRSVPIYMDGIPIYVPYDGYIDLARFTTFDIAKIDVSKGFSSMTYGANTIGGAINLVSTKPVDKMELNAKLGTTSGKGYETILNLGSNLGKIYIQADFSLLHKDYMPLSGKFQVSDPEPDHRRDNSSRQDIKESMKVGYTPNATDEYSINYVNSHSSKGNPIYLGTDKNTRIRYWKWPYWDKQSIYYISKTAIGSKSVLKAHAFFDQFSNKLSSFDDNTYSTQLKGYAFNSYYDDYSIGGNLEFARDWNSKNHIRFSFHVKNDNHSEHNENEPVRHFADNTWSLGMENVYKPINRLTFIPGLSYNIRKSLRAENYNSTDKTISDYPSNKSDALNAQLATYFLASKAAELNFNIAYKSRFATMKDRYSYRMDQTIPNPDLKSETAVNLELGVTLKLAEILNFRPELFLSRLYNTIQMVSNVEGDLSQMQNTGEAEFKGMDLSIVYQPINDLTIYASYSWIERKNLSNPGILFTDIPKNKLFASVQYKIIKKILLNVFSEYDSRRFSASDGTRVSQGFFVINSRISFEFAGGFTAEIGTNNILDRNYTIEEGYPEAGRNFYAGLYFKLHK